MFFWVLALDHDLRVATDVIGSVFVRNPAGTKVALWEEVALDEGKKSDHRLSPNYIAEQTARLNDRVTGKRHY